MNQFPYNPRTSWSGSFKTAHSLRPESNKRLMNPNKYITKGKTFKPGQGVLSRATLLQTKVPKTFTNNFAMTNAIRSTADMEKERDMDHKINVAINVYVNEQIASMIDSMKHVLYHAMTPVGQDLPLSFSNVYEQNEVDGGSSGGQTIVQSTQEVKAKDQQDFDRMKQTVNASNRNRQQIRAHQDLKSSDRLRKIVVSNHGSFSSYVMTALFAGHYMSVMETGRDPIGETKFGHDEAVASKDYMVESKAIRTIQGNKPDALLLTNRHHTFASIPTHGFSQTIHKDGSRYPESEEVEAFNRARESNEAVIQSEKSSGRYFDADEEKMFRSLLTGAFDRETSISGGKLRETASRAEESIASELGSFDEESTIGMDLMGSVARSGGSTISSRSSGSGYRGDESSVVSVDTDSIERSIRGGGDDSIMSSDSIEAALGKFTPAKEILSRSSFDTSQLLGSLVSDRIAYEIRNPEGPENAVQMFERFGVMDSEPTPLMRTGLAFADKLRSGFETREAIIDVLEGSMQPPQDFIAQLLDDLVELGASPESLDALFQEEFGKTPIEIIDLMQGQRIDIDGHPRAVFERLAEIHMQMFDDFVGGLNSVMASMDFDSRTELILPYALLEADVVYDDIGDMIDRSLEQFVLSTPLFRNDTDVINFLTGGGESEEAQDEIDDILLKRHQNLGLFQETVGQTQIREVLDDSQSQISYPIPQPEDNDLFLDSFGEGGDEEEEKGLDTPYRTPPPRKGFGDRGGATIQQDRLAQQDEEEEEEEEDLEDFMANFKPTPIPSPSPIVSSPSDVEYITSPSFYPSPSESGNETTLTGSLSFGSDSPNLVSKEEIDRVISEPLVAPNLIFPDNEQQRITVNVENEGPLYQESIEAFKSLISARGARTIQPAQIRGMMHSILKRSNVSQIGSNSAIEMFGIINEAVTAVKMDFRGTNIAFIYASLHYIVKMQQVIKQKYHHTLHTYFQLWRGLPQAILAELGGVTAQIMATFQHVSEIGARFSGRIQHHGIGDLMTMPTFLGMHLASIRKLMIGPLRQIVQREDIQEDEEAMLYLTRFIQTLQIMTPMKKLTGFKSTDPQSVLTFCCRMMGIPDQKGEFSQYDAFKQMETNAMFVPQVHPVLMSSMLIYFKRAYQRAPFKEFKKFFGLYHYLFLVCITELRKEISPAIRDSVLSGSIPLVYGAHKNSSSRYMDTFSHNGFDTNDFFDVNMGHLQRKKLSVKQIADMTMPKSKRRKTQKKPEPKKRQRR